MPMVGRRDSDDVGCLAIEQSAIIAKCLSFAKALVGAAEIHVIHIAQGNDIYFP